MVRTGDNVTAFTQFEFGISARNGSKFLKVIAPNTTIVAVIHDPVDTAAVNSVRPRPWHLHLVSM